MTDRVWVSEKGLEAAAKQFAGSFWQRWTEERRHVEMVAVRRGLDGQFIWLGHLAGFTMESGDLTGILPMLAVHRCGWTYDVEQHAYVANIVTAMCDHRRAGCVERPS